MNRLFIGMGAGFLATLIISLIMLVKNAAGVMPLGGVGRLDRVRLVDLLGEPGQALKAPDRRSARRAEEILTAQTACITHSA